MTGLIADTGDHRLIRQSTAAIAARYGHAYYAERAREGGHIAELWRELGQAGLLGVHLPAEYGGGGAGLGELTVVTEELAAHGLPLLIAVISPAICGSILAAHASDAMKASWLPGLADGTRRMAFALTEPDAGSNSRNVSTTARRAGPGWVITGGKYYISAADECEALLLVARDDSVPGGLSLFVVPAGAPA
jgi:alkylation response protein AidB-like acyl-CoA dehydrogenase